LQAAGCADDLHVTKIVRWRSWQFARRGKKSFALAGITEMLFGGKIFRPCGRPAPLNPQLMQEVCCGKKQGLARSILSRNRSAAGRNVLAIFFQSAVFSATNNMFAATGEGEPVANNMFFATNNMFSVTDNV